MERILAVQFVRVEKTRGISKRLREKKEASRLFQAFRLFQDTSIPHAIPGTNLFVQVLNRFDTQQSKRRDLLF